MQKVQQLAHTHSYRFIPSIIPPSVHSIYPLTWEARDLSVTCA